MTKVYKKCMLVGNCIG